MKEITKAIEHEKKILEVIEKHAVFTFKDIFVYYKAISRQYAYVLELDKCDTIREAIQSNKRKGVTSMLAKWVASQNATLQIAAMRLLCDNEEHRLLNQNYTELTGANGKDLIPPTFNFKNLNEK